jgi:hypothetical protein
MHWKKRCVLFDTLGVGQVRKSKNPKNLLISLIKTNFHLLHSIGFPHGIHVGKGHPITGHQGPRGGVEV